MVVVLTLASRLMQTLAAARVEAELMLIGASRASARAWLMEASRVSALAWLALLTLGVTERGLEPAWVAPVTAWVVGPPGSVDGWRSSLAYRCSSM